MTNHGNRGRVSIRPLDTNYAKYHYKILSDSLPRGWCAEGLIDDGLLARNVRTGTLAVWHGYCMKSVDQRKAALAVKGYASQGSNPAKHTPQSFFEKKQKST